MSTFNQEVSTIVAFDLQEITSDTTTVGNIIDKQGNEAMDISVIGGVITDGDYTLLLEHGDESNLSDATTLAATDLDALISTMDFADSDDQTSKSIGVVSKKRFIRPSLVSTNTTSGGFFTSEIIFGRPRRV